jgi:hypothetical protein
MHNYEAFFLDYKEGNLSAELEKELFLFLEEHPYLREELDAYEALTLPEEEVLLHNRADFKKKEFDSDALIAHTEGIDDPDTHRQINELATQNKAFEKELLYYTSTRIQPDVSLRFKNKSRLKRGRVIVLWQEAPNVWKAAAAVLLLLGFYFLFNTVLKNEDEHQAKVEVAEKKSGKEVNPVKESNTAIQRAAFSSEEKMVAEKNVARTQTFSKKRLKRDSTKNVLKENQTAVNPVENKNGNENPDQIAKDSLIEKNALTSNTSSLEKEQKNSYFNLSRDADDDQENNSTASVQPEKKSFFHKLVKAAKDVNILGIKKVNGTEEENTSTVNIGGLVVTESTE